MTRLDFSRCAAEVPAYTDRMAYISDLALSPLWGDAPDADIPQQRIEELGQVWDAINRPMREIAAAAGLSQRKLAERFMVPYRTMDSWCSSSRDLSSARACPLYTRLMMQECLGLLPIQK